MSTREQRSARYYARKAARLCVDCEAGLQDEDGVRCLECRERHARYLKTQAGRAMRAGVDRRFRAQNRAAYNASKRSRYERHKLAGLCVWCTDASTDDSLFCPRHLELNRAKSRERRARHRARLKAAEVTP